MVLIQSGFKRVTIIVHAVGAISGLSHGSEIFFPCMLSLLTSGSHLSICEANC